MIEIEKFDDCCYMITIKQNGEEVEHGIWCPRSKIIALYGKIVGHANTKEKVIKMLNPVKYDPAFFDWWKSSNPEETTLKLAQMAWDAGMNYAYNIINKQL